MENKINIAELLKDCPKGMELDCTIWDNVVLAHVDINSKYPIWIKKMEGEIEVLTENGCFNFDCGAKCVIYPKGKTTWEGFQRPFMDGDVVVCTNENCTFTAIFKSMRDDSSFYRYGVMYDNKFRCLVNDWSDFNDSCRLATEEEKQKLFDVIKENGYKWNAETKTLEKLVEPKFKVGDRVRNKNYKDYIYDIHDITDKGYKAKEINADSPIIILFGSQEDNYELVPNKFDITTLVPFESKVLVRDNKLQKWSPAMWGYYDFDSQDYPYKLVGGCARYCIPYEKNEYLLGTTNDCDDFYKTWG